MSASISKDAKGYRINLRLPCGKVTCLRGKRLGISQNQRALETVRFHISNLIAAKQTSTPIPGETCSWLERIGKALYRKLESLRLIAPRIEDEPALDYLRRFFASHGQSRKQSSVLVWQRALSHAERFFPTGISMREVSLDTAKDFVAALRREPGKKPGDTMAAATIGKTCSILAQAFDHAVEQGIIKTNPFRSRSIPRSAGRNAAREVYVDRERVLQVMSHVPDQEIRLVIALARFGGLRIPSEMRELRWTDIDWSKREMTVTSPKTEHHGKCKRRAPLFHELFEQLRQAFELNSESEFVLPRLRDSTNINMSVRRAIEEAGLAAWEKVMQNLRGSCVTDWLRAKHPPEDVARWSGHTTKVMYEHYIRITDDDSASHAALLAAGSSGVPSGDTERPGVVTPVVRSAVPCSRQEKSPATQAAGDLDFMEFADDSCELVTVGGDCGDHLSMDLIGPERSPDQPGKSGESEVCRLPVVSVRLGTPESGSRALDALMSLAIQPADSLAMAWRHLPTLARKSLLKAALELLADAGGDTGKENQHFLHQQTAASLARDGRAVR